MKRTTKNAARKAQLAVVRHDDHNGLLTHFAQSPELFAPMLNLIAQCCSAADRALTVSTRTTMKIQPLAPIELQRAIVSLARDRGAQIVDGSVLCHWIHRAGGRCYAVCVRGEIRHTLADVLSETTNRALDESKTEWVLDILDARALLRAATRATRSVSSRGNTPVTMR